MSDVKLQLVMTCEGMPEQYDVLNEYGDTVGYLRLRHGHFTAEFPDVDGEIVYEAETDGDGFFTSEERGFHIGMALAAICRRALR